MHDARYQVGHSSGDRGPEACARGARTLYEFPRGSLVPSAPPVEGRAEGWVGGGGGGGGNGGGGGGGGGSSGAGKRKRADNDQDDITKLRRQVANLEGRLRSISSMGSQSSSSSGGKGGRKGKGGGIRLPPALMGMEAVGPDGTSRCFAFKLHGCKDAKAGQKCFEGWHVCMRLGCGKPHSQRDH